METIKSVFGKFGNFVRGNQYIMAFIVLIVISYTAIIAPKLPLGTLKIFDSTIFKIGFFLVILLFAKYSFMVSLIISIAFVLSITALSNLKTVQLISDIQNAPKAEETPVQGTNQPMDATDQGLTSLAEPAQTDFHPPAQLIDAQSSNTEVAGFDKPYYAGEISN